MAKKPDMKQFLLEKGERVGLGVAAGIMVLLAGMGAVAGFTREPPTKTAEDIRANASTINAKLESGPAVSPAEIDKAALVPVETDELDPKNYSYVTDQSIGEASGGSKRSNPKVKEPDEFRTELVRAQIEYYIVTGTPPDKLRVGILINKDKPGEKTTTADPSRFTSRYTGPAGGAAHSPYGEGSYNLLQNITQDDKGISLDKYTLKFVDVKDKATQNAEYAHTVHPLRMVVVTASFPFKQELEAYRRALQKKSINELVAEKDLMPVFEPCFVRRRILLPTGKPGPWEDLKNDKVNILEDNYKAVLRQSVGTQEEDKSLKGVIFPRSPLVMFYPKLSRGEYPPLSLPKINDTVKFLQSKAVGDAPVPVLGPLASKLTGEGVNAYGPVTAVDEKAETVKDPEKKPGEELIIPEHCLIRLIDADPKLRSGATYQYQIKVRLANPNYGQKDKVNRPEEAGKQFIESEWAPEEKDIKGKTDVTLTKEMFFYATEIDDKVRTIKEKADPKLISDRSDVAYLQAHQWFESIQLNPTNPGSKVPVGDWAITEIPVRRGEFIARRENVEMPVWVPTRKGYEFAIPVLEKRPTGTRPAPGIPVDFGPREPTQLELLVDFEGGHVEHSFKVGDKAPKNVREEAALEILVMSPDGTLRVQNSRADVKDSTRESRANDLKKFQKDVLQKSKVGGPVDPLKPK